MLREIYNLKNEADKICKTLNEDCEKAVKKYRDSVVLKENRDDDDWMAKVLDFVNEDGCISYPTYRVEMIESGFVIKKTEQRGAVFYKIIQED